MNLLIFGPPGAGKGTQSALLVEKDGYYHISTGDLFRKALKEETALGKEAQVYLDKGDLVPDSVTVSMVEEALGSVGGSAFILDGFPRNTSQAEALKEMLSKKGQAIEKAIFLSVPFDVLTSRLSGRRLCKSCGAVYHIDGKPPQKEGVCDACGAMEIYQRSDDKLSVIENRLKNYEESTSPLVNYYKSEGIYTELDGLGDSSDVYERLKTLLQK